MKLTKIMNEVIKTHESKKEVFFDYDEERIYFTCNGFNIYIIPQNDFIFDLNKVGGQKKDLIKFCIDENFEDAIITNDCKKYNKKTAIKFKNEQNEIWIDEKLLKNYVLTGQVTYKINNAMLSIYENNIMVGVIIRMNI